jgi:hypothetical protein
MVKMKALKPILRNVGNYLPVHTVSKYRRLRRQCSVTQLRESQPELYLVNSPYRAVNTLRVSYTNQLANAVNTPSRYTNLSVNAV